MTGLRRSRAKFLLLILVIAGSAVGLSVPSLAGPSSAAAYSHEWNCDVGAYTKCYDNSGKIYNPWHWIGFGGEYYGGYCAKGETSSGGVIQFACADNVYLTGGKVCTSTETHAYGYGNLGPQYEAGTANTEGGC